MKKYPPYLHFVPVGKNISEASLEIEKYLKKVPPILKNCFGNVEVMHKLAYSGYEPEYYWGRISRAVVALFVFNTDPNCFANRRAVLIHATCLEVESY